MYVVKGNTALPLDMAGEVILAADVSAIPMLEAQWSRLGVPMAKLGPVAGPATITVTSSCDKRYSVGILRPSQEIMGRTLYEASTEGGFSGSAYMNGGVCLGMHCHGGAYGGGYEGLYLWNRLKQSKAEIPEASEDFLVASAKTQRWRMEDLGDSALVRMESGHYHMATSELAAKLRDLKGSTGWADQMERDEIEEELDRRGYEPECVPQPTYPGEGRGPVARATPGRSEIAQKASESSEVDAQPPLTVQLPKMKVLRAQSHEQLCDILLSLKTGKPLPPITNRPTPVPGPSGKASSAN